MYYGNTKAILLLVSGYAGNIAKDVDDYLLWLHWEISSSNEYLAIQTALDYDFQK